MTAPTTQAEQEDAVRADLAETVLDTLIDWMLITPGTTQTTETVDAVADALIKGPLATLRARAAAAEAERDEARQRADDLFWTITEPAKAARHWQMKAAAAEAQREQLAADLRKAREALNFYADPDSWAGAPWRLDFQSPGRDGHGHEVAAAALTPDPKDAAGTAKGDDHHG